MGLGCPLVNSVSSPFCRIYPLIFFAVRFSITVRKLNNYFSKLGESDEPIYKNKKCTIRKGTLYVKPTTRGRKKQG